MRGVLSLYVSFLNNESVIKTAFATCVVFGSAHTLTYSIFNSGYSLRILKEIMYICGEVWFVLHMVHLSPLFEM